MKVTVDRLELKKAVSIAKSYLPAKPLIEVDGELLMTLKDGKEMIDCPGCWQIIVK